MAKPIAEVDITLIDISGSDISSGGVTDEEQPFVVENNYVFYQGGLVKFNGYYNLVSYIPNEADSP